MQILLAALEERVFADLEEDIQIAGRPAVGARLAFVGQADAGAFVHARRDRSTFSLRCDLAVALAAALACRDCE